jgi:hypothetical protein
MPSPFPGMDPYLEHPEFFPGLHDSLLIYLREALQAQLPEAYYADIRSRVWIEYTNRVIEPDVNLLRTDRPSGPLPQPAGGEGAVAVRTPPVVVTVPGEERTESYLEIYTVRGNHSLVTAIEVLSPSNKTGGTHGREEYLKKQAELLNSRVNLVEIDLLRAGQHTTAAPRKDVLKAAGSFDYHISIRRMDDLFQYLVHPIRLEKSLPEIVIPLLPGDPGVNIDLQAVFDRCYDTGPYRRADPYRQPPEPPLTLEQAEWATRLLRDKGLLPSS